jgi:CheY-like chemotaxis protein
MNPMSKIHILLVEDNEGDILLTREAFAERKVISKLSVVKNGGDAVDFLLKRNGFENEEKPDLVLLDINLPVKSGIEVLKIIKENPDTKKIPVIMLTTSSSQKDINLAYQYHANSYITKPMDMDEFIKAIMKIEDFWFQLVKLST